MKQYALWYSSTRICDTHRRCGPTTLTPNWRLLRRPLQSFHSQRSHWLQQHPSVPAPPPHVRPPPVPSSSKTSHCTAIADGPMAFGPAQCIQSTTGNRDKISASRKLVRHGFTQSTSAACDPDYFFYLCHSTLSVRNTIATNQG